MQAAYKSYIACSSRAINAMCIRIPLLIDRITELERRAFEDTKNRPIPLSAFEKKVLYYHEACEADIECYITCIHHTIPPGFKRRHTRQQERLLTLIHELEEIIDRITIIRQMHANIV